MTMMKTFLLLLVSGAGLVLAGCGDGPLTIPGPTTPVPTTPTPTTPTPTPTTPTQPGDDHGDTEQTATVIRVPSATPGVLEGPGDLDIFRFELRSHASLHFYISGSGSSEMLALVEGPASFGIDGAYGFASAASIELPEIRAKAPPGTYYVTLLEVPSDGRSGPHQYVLHVEELPDDRNDTQQTATAIRVPSTTRGEFEVWGDVDYYRFQLRSPATLTVYTTLPEERGALAEGGLQGPDGREIRDGIEDDLEFRIVVSQARPGTYYVRLQGFLGVSAGEYELHVRTGEVGRGAGFREPRPVRDRSPAVIREFSERLKKITRSIVDGRRNR